MTIDKAVSLLSQMFLIQFSKEEHEALAMAIDALNADRKTEPTISKMEQVDKDINVRCKDKPQTKLCRECDDYTGDGMYCASNHIVYDFSTSRGNCEP